MSLARWLSRQLECARGASRAARSSGSQMRWRRGQQSQDDDQQATANDPQNSLYEVGIALAALYVYQHTGLPGYLNYAVAIVDRFTAVARNPQDGSVPASPGMRDAIENPGAYYVALHLVGPIEGDSAPLHQPLQQQRALSPPPPASPALPPARR